jgi:hypothetical protein
MEKIMKDQLDFILIKEFKWNLLFLINIYT